MRRGLAAGRARLAVCPVPARRRDTGSPRLSSAAMADRDGNGWIRCAQGHRHWGRFGAAGLLAYVPAEAGDAAVLLQRRSSWVNHPGTWGPPGGAMDSHESAVSAALREAAEECGVPAGQVTVGAILRDDHGGWSYQTVIAAARDQFPVRNASEETSEVRWISEGDVGRLDLHPGFAGQWPSLRAALAPLTIIVDVANVMGSRADGWWRDRDGAAVPGVLVPVPGASPGRRGTGRARRPAAAIRQPARRTVGRAAIRRVRACRTSAGRFVRGRAARCQPGPGGCRGGLGRRPDRRPGGAAARPAPRGDGRPGIARPVLRRRRGSDRAALAARHALTQPRLFI